MIHNLIDISRKAGEAILEYYTDEIDITRKDDDSPLTKADMAAHHIIVDELKQLTPDIPVISEEGGIAGYEERKNWSRFWLVDPLDGTKEFIKRNGEFTVNIALIEDKSPVIGVVHIPARGITYTGRKGEGAYRFGGNSILHESIVNASISEPELENRSGKKRQNLYMQGERIFSNKPGRDKSLTVVASRSHGSDDLEKMLAGLPDGGVKIGEKIPAGSSLKFCLVAEGTADIYPRMGPTMEWDTAAGDAVFRYSGRNGPRHSPLTYNKPDLRNGGFIIGLD